MTRGIILALVLGAVWGFVVAVTLGISVTLAFGVDATLTSLAATVAGIFGTAAYLLSGTRFQGRWPFFIGMAAYALPLCLLTYFAPMGLSLATDTILSLIILLSLSAITIGCIAIAFHKRDWRDLNRYRYEEVLGRALKGLGFVFFTAIVLLILMSSCSRISTLAALS